MIDTTCGVTDHPDECLCDVVVVAPTPVNYHFTDVWGADVAARAVGYREDEHCDDRFVALLEALGSAYEASRKLQGFDNGWLDGVTGLRKLVSLNLQSGHSIVDLPVVLAESMPRIVAAATNGYSSTCWAWSDSDWLRFEGWLLDRDFVEVEECMRLFGLGRSLAISITELYGCESLNSMKQRRKARLLELLKEMPKASTRQLADTLEAEGFPPSYDMVDRARRRMKK